MLFLILFISHLLASYGVDFSNEMYAMELINGVPVTIQFKKKYQLANMAVNKNLLESTYEISPNTIYNINDLVELNDDEISRKYNMDCTDKQFSINGLESKFYKSNLISSFYNLHDQIYKRSGNLVISKKDYTTDELVQSIRNIRDKKTLIVPESTCLAAYETKRINDDVCNFLIFNTRGKKTCVSFYKCEDVNKKKHIKKIYFEVLGNGDYFYDEVMRSSLENDFRQAAILAIKMYLGPKIESENVTILPAFVENSNKNENFYYDASTIFEKARSYLLNNVPVETLYSIELKNLSGVVIPLPEFKLNTTQLKEMFDKNLEKFGFEKLNAFLEDKKYKTLHVGSYAGYLLSNEYPADNIIQNNLIACGAAFLTDKEMYDVKDESIINVEFGGNSAEKERQSIIDDELKTQESFAKLKEADFALEYVEGVDKMINLWRCAMTIVDKKEILKSLESLKNLNQKTKNDHQRRPSGVTSLKNTIDEIKMNLKNIDNELHKKEITEALKSAEEWYAENVDNKDMLYSSFLTQRISLVAPYSKAISMKRFEEEERAKKKKQEEKSKAAEELKKLEEEQGKDENKATGKEDVGKTPKLDFTEFEKAINSSKFDFEEYKKILNNTSFDEKMFEDISHSQEATNAADSAENIDHNELSEANKRNEDFKVNGDEKPEAKEMVNENIADDSKNDVETDDLLNEDL